MSGELMLKKYPAGYMFIYPSIPSAFLRLAGYHNIDIYYKDHRASQNKVLAIIYSAPYTIGK